MRICGQDVGRGTFSHRHSMLVDQKCNEIYIPLNNMTEEQAGKLEVRLCFFTQELKIAMRNVFHSLLQFYLAYSTK